jgi:hypothetical protein
MPRNTTAAARRRAAAQQQHSRRVLEDRRTKRRRVTFGAGGGVLLVGAVVAALVMTIGGTPTGNRLRPAAPGSAVSAVTAVPPATTAAIGIPAGLTWPTPLSGQPASTAAGKPQIFFATAEYCSYCGAESWPVVEALSRFGRFQDLGQVYASDSDYPARTPSFTFYGSTYRSSYVTFVPVELYDTTGGLVTGYQSLQSPTKADQELINRYDTPPLLGDDGVPFLDLGNRYILKGQQFSPQELAGLTVAQVGQRLQTGTGTLTRDIDGSANLLTGAICELTGNLPASVCGAAPIPQVEADLRRS